MGKNFNISSNGKYDLTKTSLNDVNAQNVDEKETSKLRLIFGNFDLNGDGKLNALELARAFDYFSSLDTEEGVANGVLSNNELNTGAQQLSETLGLNKKDSIKAKDITNFIKQLKNLTKKTDFIDIQELFFFMDESDENSEFDIQNLVNAEFDESENALGGGARGAYTLTYKSGTIVKVKNDKTYDIITKDESGKTTVASYNSNRQLVKKVITDANNNVETINYTTVMDDVTQQPVTVISTSSVVYSNGDTENTEYDTTYLNGNKESNPLRMVQVTTIDGVQITSVSTYSAGQRNSEIVTSGDTELKYSCIGDADAQLVSKKENIGSENECTTLYTYNDNNTVSVTITEGNKITTQVRAIPLGGNVRTAINDERTITYESINEEGSQTEIVYLEEGHGNARIETVTGSDGRISRTIYNENGNRTSFVVEYNGQEYSAEYDGEGNTYMIFTVDDPIRISRLARSFETTPEAIYILNNDLVHIDQTNGAKYFVAGTKIKIPGEIPADNRYLQARGSQEYETARGNQLWGDITDAVNAETASRSTSLIRVNETGTFSNFRDFALYLFAQEGNTEPNRYLVDARVNELKDMNQGLVDGQLAGKQIRFKYSAQKEEQVHRENLETQRNQNKIRLQNENRAADPIARRIYSIINGKSYAVQREGGADLFRGVVNSSNIISVLEKYKELNNGKSLFSHINAEWDSTYGDEYNKEAMEYLIGVLANRCRSAGIDGDNITAFDGSAYYYIVKLDMDNLNALVDKLCSQCRLLEGGTQEETDSSIQRNISVYQTTLGGLDVHATSATNTLDYFNNNEETLCGCIWEGLKWLVTLGSAENLDENVKKEIEKFQDYIKELDNAFKAGGENAFRARFRQIFRCNFDMNIARQYAVKLENYRNAKAIQDIRNAVDNIRGAWKISELSYENLVNCYKLVLRKIDTQNNNPNATIEQILMEKLGENYPNATVLEKRRVLAAVLQNFMTTITNELVINNYTGGKTLQQLEAELSEHSGDLFGTNDLNMMNRVNNYIISQKAGDAYISTGLKVVGMAAFGLCGGGVALSTFGTFASSMTVDVLNHPDPFNDSTQMWQIVKEAAIDGMFSGAGTFVRDSLKVGKFVFGSKELDVTRHVNITKGNASFVKTQGVLIGADSSVSVTGQAIREGVKPENIAITFLWSTIAHVGSAKITSNSNVQRCFRRTGKGGGKEEREANKDFNADQPQSGGFDPEKMRVQCSQYLASLKNLGDLNAMKRFVNQIPQEYGRNELIAMIDRRTNDLLADRAKIIVDRVSLSPETRTNAIRALEQPATHLLPEQMEDIMDYVDAISDPNELFMAMTQLQRHGIDFNEQSDIRAVLDDKFAEFNRMPPYNVGEDFILYAHNQEPAQTPTANSAFANSPTLDSFINSNEPMTMLTPEFYQKLKNDLYNIADSINSQEDVANFLARFDTISDENQRNELRGIIDSIARMKGISLT